MKNNLYRPYHRGIGSFCHFGRQQCGKKIQPLCSHEKCSKPLFSTKFRQKLPYLADCSILLDIIGTFSDRKSPLFRFETNRSPAVNIGLAKFVAFRVIALSHTWSFISALELLGQDVVHFSIVSGTKHLKKSVLLV